MASSVIPRAMLGALIGDAVGAVLEFCDAEITEERAEEALAFPGGGPHRIGKGQITDDGELTLTLWQALVSEEERPKAMMRAYADWLYSVPFDCGFTCQNAFDACSNVVEGTMTMKNYTKGVRSMNGRSEANGALMRATAIASYVDRFHHGDTALGLELAKQDVLLSHPSLVCVEVNQVYVYALLLLLESKPPSAVVESLNRYILDNVQSKCIPTWYFQESLDISEMGCTHQAGHVRWGFVQAMYFLRHPEMRFEEVLKRVLMLGGDTDTNACIVGGLVACYQEIPQRLSEPVVVFDPSKESRGHRWRPREYSVGGAFSIQ